MTAQIKNYFCEMLSVVKSWKKYLRVDIVLAILYLASLISPTLSALTRLDFAYPIFFGLYLLWFMATIIHYRRAGVKFMIDKRRYVEVIALIIWLIAITLNMLLGRGENGYWAIIYTIMFMTVYMMDFVYSSFNDRKIVKVLIIATIFMFAVDSLRSMIILRSEPFTARLMNAYYEDDVKRYFRLELLGLGSYQFFTATAIALPGIFYMVVKSKRKLIMAIMYSIIVSGIFFSGYTGSNLLVFVMIFVLLIYTIFICKDKKLRKTLFILILITIIVVVLTLFLFIHKDMLYKEYFLKYRDLLKFILGVNELNMPKITSTPGLGGNKEDYAKLGYRTASRMSFYFTSLKTFAENPIFGVGPYFRTATVANGIGNHSSWLDFLAMYGLVGCAPLILCFVYFFKRSVQSSKKGLEKFIRVLSWIFFMGYGLFNPVFVARAFPPVFALIVTGNTSISDNLISLRDWLKFKQNFENRKQKN